MEPLAILHADPLDLLFENRNKSYGSYTLRKFYPQWLLISLGITSSLVVASQTTTKPLPTVEDLRLNAIGLRTTPGTPGNGEPSIQSNTSTGLGIGDSVESKPAILERAEVMPEFPGGIEALKRFLLKNLHMPETDLQAGTEIQVVARFVVAADGSVGDIEIVQPAEAVFNAEVKRVIEKMPDWKPGSQNQRNVAVYFNLPVHFVTAE
jgi:periplasmic protein TonB